jgi:hypothetical protein
MNKSAKFGLKERETIFFLCSPVSKLSKKIKRKG